MGRQQMIIDELMERLAQGIAQGGGDPEKALDIAVETSKARAVEAVGHIKTLMYNIRNITNEYELDLRMSNFYVYLECGFEETVFDDKNPTPLVKNCFCKKSLAQKFTSITPEREDAKRIVEE